MSEPDFKELYTGRKKKHVSKKQRTPTAKKKAVKQAPKKSKSGPQPVTVSKKDDRDQLKEIEWFFEDLGRSKKIYIGIDPGTTGAIGLLHPTKESRSTAVDIPTYEIVTSKRTKSKKGFRKRRRFDNAQVWEYFKLMLKYKDRIVIALEKGQTRHTDNGITGLAVGIGYGMWPLFLTSHGFDFEEFIPSVWKPRMGLSGEDKERSRYMAQKLWPGAPLLRVGDHNRAEAMLLAEYIKRKRNGNSNKRSS